MGRVVFLLAVIAVFLTSCAESPPERRVEAATAEITPVAAKSRRARKAPIPTFSTSTLRASPRPTPRVRAAAAPTGNWGKWHPILMCESGGNWHINTGNGYYGGLQFHDPTWDAYKPDGYPDKAHQATPEQQMYVAEKVLAVQGWKAWPACSRKVGYR